MDNWMELSFPSLSVNESFARSAVAAFAASLNPTLDELSDLRTAVSEAVTNAILHGYDNRPEGRVFLRCEKQDRTITVTVRDMGCGIEDIELARRPFYTSKPELERSGMGFSVMEAFTDRVSVLSHPREGTTITMEKPWDSPRSRKPVLYEDAWRISAPGSGLCTGEIRSRKRLCCRKTCPLPMPLPAATETAASKRRICASWPVWGS